MLQFQKLVSICRKILHLNLLDSMNCRNACMIGDLRKSLFAFFPSQRCCGFMFSQKSYVICRQVFDVVLHKPKKFRFVKWIWKSCVIGAATSLYRKFHDTLTIGRTMETRRRAVHQQKPLTYSIFPGTHGVYCFSWNHKGLDVWSSVAWRQFIFIDGEQAHLAKLRCSCSFALVSPMLG